MQEEGRWVTLKDGRKIFIKNKDINNYMNERIKDTVIRINNKKAKQEYQIPDNIILNEYRNGEDFYITEISPDDYLKLTTSSYAGTSPEMIQEEVKDRKYTANILTATNKGYIMLEMNMNTGEVVKHDGRHRMVGLKQAGYKKVQILVFPLWDDYQGFKQQSYRTVKNQYGDGFSTYFEQMIPVNEEYIKKIKE